MSNLFIVNKHSGLTKDKKPDIMQRNFWKGGWLMKGRFIHPSQNRQLINSS
jgi:hypothetical protein